jgi:hypothetical protein
MIWSLKNILVLLCVDGIFTYPLALYMGYPQEAYFTGFGCGGIVTISANGHGVFLWDIGYDLVLIRIDSRYNAGQFLYLFGLGSVLFAEVESGFKVVLLTRCNDGKLIKSFLFEEKYASYLYLMLTSENFFFRFVLLSTLASSVSQTHNPYFVQIKIISIPR